MTARDTRNSVIIVLVVFLLGVLGPLFAASADRAASTQEPRGNEAPPAAEEGSAPEALAFLLLY